MKFKEWFLLESNQEIVNLGYPLIIAKLFSARFGKHAFLIARWFREYHSHGDTENWWRRLTPGFGTSLSLPDLVFLYDSTGSEETYRAAQKHLDLYVDKDFYDEDETREAIKREIEEQLSENIFFKAYSIIQDIESGTLIDVAPYKKLRFEEAQFKYDEKRVVNSCPKIYRNLPIPQEKSF